MLKPQAEDLTLILMLLNTQMDNTPPLFFQQPQVEVMKPTLLNHQFVMEMK
jgi:hypothetical protein